LLYTPRCGAQGDIYQLGGDFIVDHASGRFVLPYYSRESVDRPSVDALLAALDGFARTGRTAAQPPAAGPAPAVGSS
jgi:hypothetical protein